MATHSSILPEQSHGQRSLEGYSPLDCKESDMNEQVTVSLTPALTFSPFSNRKVTPFVNI